MSLHVSFNSFGYIYKFSTWGESHGKAIGCTIDGVPSCMDLDEQYIQGYVDKRRPGYSDGLSTDRVEEDKVEILSGVFQNKTTGTPISIMIINNDCRSEDYEELTTKYRPGHADLLYKLKYSNYDHRGGGRSSGRETASRVIAGAVARKIIPSQVKIRGAVTRVGSKAFTGEIDWDFASSNPLFCPDPRLLEEWTQYIRAIKNDGDSIGAMCELQITGVPPGIGEPVYKKLDAYIAEGIMGINAVKSVEIGMGSDSAFIKGSDYVDELRNSGCKHPMYTSNNSGGIIGGISTGMPILIKFAVRPASSTRCPVNTVDYNFQNTVLSMYGRHDPCIGIRVVPVAEAMVACILADLTLMSKVRRYCNYHYNSVIGSSM